MKAFILLLLIPCLGQAAEGDLFRDLFAAPKRAGRDRISYRGELYSSEPVQGSRSELQLRAQEVELSHVVETEPDFLNLEARAQLQEPRTAARFPVSGNALPEKLWNIGFGGNFRRQLEGDRTLTMGMNIGSASDRPFHSARELSLSANLIYRFRASAGNDQWLLMVNESNTRGFWPWVPVPGIGYLFDRQDEFKFFLGLPVAAFFWKPGPKWMVTGFYFPVETGRLELTYFLFGPARVYTGFQSSQEVFLRAGRDDKRDRLYALEKDLHLGLVMPATRFLLADLSGRYVFRRAYYEGKGFRDRRTGRRIDADPAKSIQLRLTAAF